MPAAITLAGDFLKGFLAVAIGTYFKMSEASLGMICFAAVIGHIFPIFYNFKGGKGVAVFIGVTAGLSPLSATIFCLSWLFIAKISRYSSLSAIMSVLFSVPVLYLVTKSTEIFVFFIFIAIIIIAKHSENIIRLRQGTEQKIGEK